MSNDTNHVTELQSEQDLRRRALEQRERAEVQLAGCLAASDGWADKGDAPAPTDGDYGWSPAFQAALDNRRRLEVIEEAIKEAEAEATFDNPHETGVRAMAATIRGRLISAGLGGFVGGSAKVATIGIVLLLALVGCATEEPATGTQESSLEYTDGGLLIVDDEESRDEVFALATGCPTPAEWWDSREQGPLTVYSHEVENENGDGYHLREKNCVTKYNRMLTQYIPEVCTACCWTERHCELSPGFPPFPFCWDEIKCGPPTCYADFGPP